MAEIIFDALDPNTACLEAPPKTPQTQDKCQVEASFHIQGDLTPPNPTIAFRRSRDKFILESTADRDATIALLRGYGFSDSNDRLQSALFYAVELNRFIKNTYLSFVPKHNYQGPSLLPLGGRLRNFFVTGSIQESDPRQTAEAGALLKEILEKPKGARDYFTVVLKSLTTDEHNRAVFHPSIRPRLQWVGDLLKAFEEIQQPLSNLKDPMILIEVNRVLVSLLTYLGTGEGDWMALKKEIDAQASLLFPLSNLNPELKNFQALLLKALLPLEKTAFAIQSPGLGARLREVSLELKEAVKEHRAELSALESASPSQALLRSLEVRLAQAAQKEDLHEFVSQEIKESKMSSSWLKRNENLSELSGAILPAFKGVVDAKAAPRLQIDGKELKRRVDRLIDSHGIQQREFIVGVLAVLRFLLGRDLNNSQILGWSKDQYMSLKVELSPEDKKKLEMLKNGLKMKISRSLKYTNLILPIVEGGICVAGLAMGGAGLGTDDRGLIVGGSTVTGLGCGALITHFAFRSRNPYIADPIGGALGAITGFGLSYGLTEPSKGINLDGRNPVIPFGP